MTRLQAIWCALFAGLAVAASAQPGAVVELDDFLNPGEHEGLRVFASRIAIGRAWNSIDQYRPADQDVGFVHITNSFYVGRLQFDYEHTEVLGDDRPVQACACDPPGYFPTPPPPDAVPAAPPPGSSDALQAAFYVPVLGGPERIPVMLRYQVSWTRRTIHTDITLPHTNEVVAHRSGREQSFALDGDTYVRIRGQDLYGSIRLARTVVTGTTADRSQTEFTYSHRFPGFAYRRVLFRPLFTFGGITNRDGTAINLVNPYLEAFWREKKTRVNFHLVYSPQMLNSGAEGWRTHHQVAIFADWGIVKLFNATVLKAAPPSTW